MIEGAPAKVNLALHVRRRRADGYHDLETLFAFTEFGDTLAFADSDWLDLCVTGGFAAAAGAGGDNLVLRAATALAAAAGVAARGTLTLDKRIPVAAGLGGGSADAAAALRLLSRAWQLDWPLERLAEVARTLGADVPACVFSRTAAGSGIGDTLAPVDVGLAEQPILLVNPRVAMATPPVFGGWDGIDRGGLEPTDWRTSRNDLTPAAALIAPVIADVLAMLTESGATFVRMSGSGATCLALYDSSSACAAAALVASERGWWAEPTRLV